MAARRAARRSIPGLRVFERWEKGFFPLRSERYDLVMRKRTTDMSAVKAFLDVLQRATLRRKLEVLAGHHTSQTGTLLV